MERKRLLIIVGPLAINIIISGMILPFAIPPFGGYSLRELFEVLLWQGIGTVGWPFAILGTFLSLPFAKDVPRWGDLLLTLMMYPAMLVLLIRNLTAKALRLWELVLLHFLVTFSFAAIWYRVLNGYNFMVE